MYPLEFGWVQITNGCRNTEASCGTVVEKGMVKVGLDGFFDQNVEGM